MGNKGVAFDFVSVFAFVLKSCVRRHHPMPPSFLPPPSGLSSVGRSSTVWRSVRSAHLPTSGTLSFMAVGWVGDFLVRCPFCASIIRSSRWLALFDYRGQARLSGHSVATMVGRKIAADDKVDHWNRRAEEVRQNVLMTEVTQHLRAHPQHLEPVASKLHSLGVEFRADNPQAKENDVSAPKDNNFFDPGVPLEQVPFPKLKNMILLLDQKFCNET